MTRRPRTCPRRGSPQRRQSVSRPSKNRRSPAQAAPRSSLPRSSPSFPTPSKPFPESWPGPLGPRRRSPRPCSRDPPHPTLRARSTAFRRVNPRPTRPGKSSTPASGMPWPGVTGRLRARFWTSASRPRSWRSPRPLPSGLPRRRALASSADSPHASSPSHGTSRAASRGEQVVPSAREPARRQGRPWSAGLQRLPRRRPKACWLTLPRRRSMTPTAPRARRWSRRRSTAGASARCSEACAGSPGEAPWQRGWRAGSRRIKRGCSSLRRRRT